MTLEEALEAREQALRHGSIDTMAIERICELLPGDDPRHPFHEAHKLGEAVAERQESALLRALSSTNS